MTFIPIARISTSGVTFKLLEQAQPATLSPLIDPRTGQIEAMAGLDQNVD
jgi:hypothetical protein